jgi:hypothetical protein
MFWRPDVALAGSFALLVASSAAVACDVSAAVCARAPEAVAIAMANTETGTANIDFISLILSISSVST